MRNTKIAIYEASQKDRIKLYDHLIALGETVFSGTGLRDKHYDCTLFICKPSGTWSGFGSTKQSDAISIDEFIEKYPVVHTVTQTPLQSSSYQYKPGDKVKVIPTITKGYSYDVYVNEEMVEKAGKIFTLVKTTNNPGTRKVCWKFKGNPFDWSEDLFELVEQTEQGSEQSPPKQGSSVQIGQKYKNSVGTINIITKVTSTQVFYKSEKDNKEYFCTIANIKKNWKLITEVEITQTPPTQQIIKKDKYEIGAKVKIREDLKRHHNTNSYMCGLAGTVVTITGYYDRTGYTFEGWNSYYWSTDMFEGEVIESQIEPQPTVSQEQKFKVGDKVKLKAGLENGKVYNGLTYFDVFRSRITTGTISNAKKSSEGYQYSIDKMWYGEDTLELDTTATIVPKYPIGFTFKLNYVPTHSEVKVIEIKQSTSKPPVYNLQYVNTGKVTGFVSEDFIDNEVASLTLATIPIPAANISISSVQDTLINSEASAVDTKKSKEVTGTPLGGTNQPTIKREKKTMAKAIKDTAIATLDQNKQAAIIAGKMEAGRILNKQVIKQIKPHLPIFVKGYLDTPLAPVVVANLVAAIGNHTQNRRVQQVSELMLLAAADTTVQSFNLDKIIDDVLAGVKLPAGILDTDEE